MHWTQDPKNRERLLAIRKKQAENRRKHATKNGRPRRSSKGKQFQEPRPPREKISVELPIMFVDGCEFAIAKMPKPHPTLSKFLADALFDHFGFTEA